MDNKRDIIKVDKIGKLDQEFIARAFLPLVEDFFKKPGVKEDYEKWLKNHNKISV